MKISEDLHVSGYSTFDDGISGVDATFSNNMTVHNELVVNGSTESKNLYTQAIFPRNTNDDIYMNSSFTPSGNKRYSLGSSTAYWKDLYVNTAYTNSVRSSGDIITSSNVIAGGNITALLDVNCKQLHGLLPVSNHPGPRITDIDPAVGMISVVTISVQAILANVMTGTDAIAPGFRLIINNTNGNNMFFARPLVSGFQKITDVSLARKTFYIITLTPIVGIQQGGSEMYAIVMFNSAPA